MKYIIITQDTSLYQTRHHDCGHTHGLPAANRLRPERQQRRSGGSDTAKKVTIQNKGSDTMVNLAQAWAEEYHKVPRTWMWKSRAAVRAWASPR